MKKTILFCKAIFILILLFTFSFAQAQPSSWQSRGVGGGGSLFYPTINPANDNEFYIACDMSQLFHSTDFGNSYSQVPFTRLQVGNLSTYEFTSNNNIAYCIANDGNINYAVRTLDGGNSWNAVPGNPLDGEDVFALKTDYANPGRIVMDYYNAIYFSKDTGKTFSLVWTGSNSGAGITTAGIFFDANNIYIGTNEGILFSANGGTSFTKLVTTGMPASDAIFSFAGAKVGSTTRFFCITANAGDIYNGYAPYDYYGLATAVYSMDAGTNVWVPKTGGINLASDFVMYVGMARNDINTVYLGGSDGNTGGNMVIKTTNAGTGWNKVFLTNNNQNIRTGWSGYQGDRDWSFGETCFGIAVAPNNSNKVLFGDFGFVHTTSDGGATWKQAYVNSTDEHTAAAPTPKRQYYNSIGLENTTTWQLHWQDANNMFAAFSDIKGIRSANAGQSWSFDYSGQNANSMYRIAKNISNATMYAATSNVHDMYQSTRLQDAQLDATDAEGKILYSTNNGTAWAVLHLFSHPVFWIATDPNNANRMYASVISSAAAQGGIWMTNDLNNLGTSNWTKLPNPPRTQGHPAAIVVLNDGKMVCTYSGRRTTTAFTASSGVFIYDPAGNSWTDVSDAGMQYWTKDIVIDPTDPTQNTWYVCVFSGWGGAPNGLGGLYKTTNRGGSWTKLTGTQFDRVTSISFNPSMTTQAYLTTETQGLWISNNMNAATPSWSLVNAYPFRQPERVFFNPYNVNEVWVTSFGNGLKLGLSNPIPLRLISFTGNRQNNHTQLQWITANEDRGDQFEIERSTNGINFEKIGSVNGKGSRQYNFDDDIAATTLYYRLKIISATGNFSYSNIIVFKSSKIDYIKLLGNPVKENIFLQLALQKEDQLQLLLSDINGKILLQQQLTVSAGTSQLTIALPAQYANGMYMLKVTGSQLKANMRVLLMK
ncbi:MAG: T9SS type A sorting domain-containing protein [Ferruginibacter sp.]